jgi:hypothetical protein
MYRKLPLLPALNGCVYLPFFPLYSTISYRTVLANTTACSTLRNCCRCVLPQQKKRSSLLDSLDWSRKYEVLSFSRLTLSSLEFTNEQIASLTDEDMQAIADGVQNIYFDGFQMCIQSITALKLAEKRK